MSAGRMEAFSDGVLAIIITVMVLQLRQPSSPTFSGLRSSLPDLLAYVLSFVFLAIYWTNHHHLLKTVHRVTGGILWANLDLLFWLSLFPFVTAWMADNHFAAAPVVLYGCVSSAAAVAYYVLQVVIVRSQGPNSALAVALGRDLKGKISVVVFAAGVIVAFWSRWLALALYAMVAISWLIPDRRLEPVIEGRSHWPSDGLPES